MPDSTLDIAVEAGGTTQHSRIPMEGGVVLDGAVAMRLAAAGRLQPGTEVTVRTFDPSALSARDVTVRVTATDTLILPDSAAIGEAGRWKAMVWDTIPVWRVEQQFGGISLASWVDEDGLLVRAESPLGFDVERTTYELARQEWADARVDPALVSGYGALIEGTAVSSNVDLSEIESTQALRVRLKGVELEGFDLSGGRQTLHGDTLVVTREDPASYATAGYALPFAGSGEAAAELEATPLIQSDDPRIRGKALDVTQQTNDPSIAALRLSEWIYATLRKEITASIPSAIQVLDALRGDCNEHTVLFVAMARSIGLPARTAVGLVNVRGRFYYHAWPEVWLAGKWVAFDPTLGQTPADASHLRFVVGGLARQVELIRLIGKLEIEAQ
jgi:transglutaminase-like putative cysteine protease